MPKHNYYEIIKTILIKLKQNLWIFGPAGSGKTYLINQIAEEEKIPTITFNCGIGTTFDDLCGYLNLQNEIVEGILWKYISIPSIIILDEIDLLEPKIQNQLNSLLETGELYIMSNKKIKHPDCLIVGTANTNGLNQNINYSTREISDISLLSRFVQIKIEEDLEMEKKILNNTTTNLSLIENTIYLIQTINKYCHENQLLNNYTFRKSKQITILSNNFDNFWIVDNFLAKNDDNWLDIMCNKDCFIALLNFLNMPTTDDIKIKKQQEEYQNKKTSNIFEKNNKKEQEKKETEKSNKKITDKKLKDDDININIFG